MKILNLQQGTAEWLEARAKHFCASEAAAMMGVSKYMTRDDLLRLKHTGQAEEVDEQKQRLFDRGHETEAAARKIIEEMLGEELYPITATDDEGFLLASSDGVTMGGDIGFEHKLWNKDLVAAVQAGEIPESHYWQLEHQILVLGLEKVRFVVSDGTQGNMVCHDYTPQPGRAAKLIAGWKQFQQDLANYKRVEVLPPVTGKVLAKLPALSVTISGGVQTTNLPIFRDAALAFIESINTTLKTDQDFADAENTIKFCDEAEDQLETVKKAALAQTASIDELFRTIDHLRDSMRSKRLELERLVKNRKTQIREEILDEGVDAFNDHIAALNARLGKPYMPKMDTNFAGVMKGKRTIASLRGAVNTELARLKIAANEIADRIELNRKSLTGEAHDWMFLFPDFAAVAIKAPEDFAALLSMRIGQHKEAEAKKEADLRAKIEAERKKKEEADRAAAAQALATPTPAVNVTAAAPAPVGQATVAVTPPNTPKPAVKLTPTGPRPTDNDIIKTLANRYNVPELKVIGWLEVMNLQSARAMREQGVQVTA